jgi:hypothetical protein
LSLHCWFFPLLCGNFSLWCNPFVYFYFFLCTFEVFSKISCSLQFPLCFLPTVSQIDSLYSIVKTNLTWIL